MENKGSVDPSAEDREYHATRVESWVCKDCGTPARFPRYNHPAKLFETRTGRCGEWANAFTAICKALGHDARLVLDWTDHVWTEVFVAEFDRWVHMDSCENAFDTPHIYEQGWGKKLTYCVAFSNIEIVDVTERYVLDRVLNLQRRDKVNEKWLKEAIKNRRSYLWEMQGPEKAVQFA